MLAYLYASSLRGVELEAAFNDNMIDALSCSLPYHKKYWIQLMVVGLRGDGPYSMCDAGVWFEKALVAYNCVLVDYQPLRAYDSIFAPSDKVFHDDLMAALGHLGGLPDGPRGCGYENLSLACRHATEKKNYVTVNAAAYNYLCKCFAKTTAAFLTRGRDFLSARCNIEEVDSLDVFEAVVLSFANAKRLFGIPRNDEVSGGNAEFFSVFQGCLLLWCNRFPSYQ